MALLHPLRRVKRTLNALRGKDIFQNIQTTCSKISLGNDHACWSICPGLLSGKSIVYSLGVGEDISFDLEVIRGFGCQVFAFDPTPRVVHWIATQSLPTEFKFHALGVAGCDGISHFTPPANPAHVSHTLLQRGTSPAVIKLPVRRLITIMQEFGHTQIDLLKMDIEGAEYEVIADLLAERIRVKQLLVEFHHRWHEVGIMKTKKAIQALNDAGYLIFDVSSTGEEYSFLLNQTIVLNN